MHECHARTYTHAFLSVDCATFFVDATQIEIFFIWSAEVKAMKTSEMDFDKIPLFFIIPYGYLCELFLSALLT